MTQHMPRAALPHSSGFPSQGEVNGLAMQPVKYGHSHRCLAPHPQARLASSALTAARAAPGTQSAVAEGAPGPSCRRWQVLAKRPLVHTQQTVLLNAWTGCTPLPCPALFRCCPSNNSCRKNQCIQPGQQMCASGTICPATSTCCGGTCCDSGVSLRIRGAPGGRFKGGAGCRHDAQACLAVPCLNNA